MATLVLAVTGHRNVAPGDAVLSQLVRHECQRLAEAHAAADCVILSALAEGADRLVAEVAMGELGARLVAVLPMPRTAYEEDFAAPASRRHFAELLAKAERTVVAPLLSPAKAWPATGEARSRQYAWAGAYFARNADVLFALWDGEPARGTGGTADVVAWFLAGKTPRRYGLSRYRLRRMAVLDPPLLVHIDPATGRIERACARSSASR